MAKKRTSKRLAGISFRQIEESITKVEKNIRAVPVKRGQEVFDKEASLKLCAALKALLRCFCIPKGEEGFIPFFIGK
jgi:hypothetical protein